MWQCVHVDGTPYTAEDGADHARLEFEYWARNEKVAPEQVELCWRAWKAASQDRLNPFVPYLHERY